MISQNISKIREECISLKESQLFSPDNNNFKLSSLLDQNLRRREHFSREFYQMLNQTQNIIFLRSREKISEKKAPIFSKVD